MKDKPKDVTGTGGRDKPPGPKPPGRTGNPNFKPNHNTKPNSPHSTINVINRKLSRIPTRRPKPRQTNYLNSLTTPPYPGFNGLKFFSAYRNKRGTMRYRRVVHEIDRYTGRTVRAVVLPTRYLIPPDGGVNTWRFKPYTEKFDKLWERFMQGNRTVPETKMFSFKSGRLTRIMGMEIKRFARIAGVSSHWINKMADTDRDPIQAKLLTRKDRILMARVADTINILVTPNSRITYYHINQYMRPRPDLPDSEWKLKPGAELAFLLYLIRNISHNTMLKWFAHHSIELSMIHERMRIHYANRILPEERTPTVADGIRLAQESIIRSMENDKVEGVEEIDELEESQELEDSD